MPFARVGEIDLHYVEDGSGPLIVLLHGFPEFWYSWRHQIPALAAAGFRVLAPDMRGYNESEKPRGAQAYRMELLADDVVGLVRHARAPRASLVGHDWGGAVAWAAAAWHAPRLISMTSITTPHLRALLRAMVTSTQALRSAYMVFNQLPWIPEATMKSGPGGKAFVRTLVRSGLSEGRAEEYLAFMRSGASGPALNWYRAVPFNRIDRVGPVDVPVLYVYAAADFALGRRAADLTAGYVRGPYRLCVLDGASHWVPEEHADAAAPLLLEHLAAYPA
jgi:pimeloyl-ACP methyl ester carboxylesterase